VNSSSASLQSDFKGGGRGGGVRTAEVVFSFFLSFLLCHVARLCFLHISLLNFVEWIRFDLRYDS